MPSFNIAASLRRDGKRIHGPPPQPSLPAVRRAVAALIALPMLRRCPHCRKTFRLQQRHD